MEITVEVIVFRAISRNVSYSIQVRESVMRGAYKGNERMKISHNISKNKSELVKPLYHTSNTISAKQ
jgi:hypothetical protein